MKLDKENIVKNRFWILVGTASGLTLIGWILMLLTVPATVGQERAKIEKEWNNKKKYQGFKNPEAVQAMKAQAEKLDKERAKIHSAMYKSQATESFLMTWPKSMVEAGFDFKDGKFVTEVDVLKLDPKGDANQLKALPPDSDTQISGTLTATEADWFKIKDRQGNTIQFMKVPHTKVIFAEGGPKDLPGFGDLGRKLQHPVKVKFVVGKFFGDELTETEISTYRDTYKEQLADVLAELRPVNYLKEPQVLLRYSKMRGTMTKTLKAKLANDCWVYNSDELPPEDNRFFSYVSKNGPGNWNYNTRDISPEEIWAAQENLWVQRDLYKQLRSVNDSVAAFERVKDDKDAKDGWSKFRNFYWEIELKVHPGSVEAKLRNLRPDRQNINNLRFLLRFKDANNKDAKPSEPVLFPPKEPTNMRFPGASVEPAGSANDRFPAQGAAPASFDLPGPLAEVDSVEQVLTVETAAVKRLDVVTIAVSPITGEMALSHRLAKEAKFEPFKAKKAPPKAAQKAADIKQNIEDTLNVPNPGNKLDAQPNPDDAVVGDEPAAVNLDPVGSVQLSLNDLVLDRYLEKTNEYRKLPVALVLVVGPEHVNRVEAALASSPLRFLTTQVLWQRCQLTLGGAPSTASTPSAPKTGLAGPVTAAASGGDSQENVELTIYGVVTLYDRPGRPAEKQPPPPPPPPPLKK